MSYLITILSTGATFEATDFGRALTIVANETGLDRTGFDGHGAWFVENDRDVFRGGFDEAGDDAGEYRNTGFTILAPVGDDA